MNDNLKIIGLSALLVLAIFGIWNWYSNDELVTGTVVSKWVESSTSCDNEGDCTTTHTYLIQLQNEKIYQVGWGSLHYDRIQPGDEIKFMAYGYSLSFYGWRVAQPSFFEFEIVSRKEVPGKPGSSLFLQKINSNFLHNLPVPTNSFRFHFKFYYIEKIVSKNF